jgi:guanosine-3',5'-bis(diphosphate) 3'-pyrophosphohydrolase
MTPKTKTRHQGLEDLLTRTASYMPDADLSVLERAYAFADKAHKGQVRRSGEEFMQHPLGTALILAGLQTDLVTLTAALLHDTVEDTSVTLAQVKKEFGEEVAMLVDGVSKLGRIEFRSREEHQAQNLRKMLIAMARDIRVIVIKLADRLHNMRTVAYMDREKQIQKARETMEIYAPLAHRLGISQLKWELEDLAFQTLEPEKFRQVQKMVAERREAREAYVAECSRILQDEFTRIGLAAEVSGRPKHFYSIHEKMSQRGKEFNEIYDLSGLRILVDSVHDCYAALGAIHSLWKPMPGRFKDYIAMPKVNMYQSLHTTVIGPQGKPLEIQIRTHAMNRMGEYGVAAHWRYKEGPSKADTRFDERLSWLRQMLEWQTDLKDPREFMETLKVDLFDEEVFVFTPAGDVISLGSGSTPVDFAYAVHSDVGNHYVGAKVNNQIVPLRYELQMGDVVEVMTNKNSAGPSKDWLAVVKTSKAKNKIKQWFSKESREEHEEMGRETLQKVLRKQGMSLNPAPTMRALEQIAKDMNFAHAEDLFISIGAGKSSAKQVMTKLLSVMQKEPAEAHEETKRPVVPVKRRRPSKTGISVRGVSDVLVRIARCCNPVPGDEVVGFVTRGRGISVHRRECPNAVELSESSPDRLIEVEWDTGQPALFQVEIQVEALDRTRLLRDVSSAVSDSGVNILAANVNTSREGIAMLRFIFEISNLSQLTGLLASVKRIDGVFDARRVLPGQP